MYSTVSHEIRVTVRPEYLEDQSSPREGRYCWAYHIEIENLGDETVQLRSRYWRIIDGLGRTQEVRGAGVVQEQPILEPGGSFSYTSGAPLSTPSGMMVGTYEMEMLSDGRAGETIEVAIPAFSLDSPDGLARPH